MDGVGVSHHKFDTSKHVSGGQQIFALFIAVLLSAKGKESQNARSTFSSRIYTQVMANDGISFALGQYNTMFIETEKFSR